MVDNHTRHTLKKSAGAPTPGPWPGPPRLGAAFCQGLQGQGKRTTGRAPRPEAGDGPGGQEAQRLFERGLEVDGTAARRPGVATCLRCVVGNRATVGHSIE